MSCADMTFQRTKHPKTSKRQTHKGRSKTRATKPRKRNCPAQERGHPIVLRHSQKNGCRLWQNNERSLQRRRYYMSVEYHNKNVRKYAFKNKEKFKNQLTQLTKILTHLIPSTSCLRNTLVKVTGSCLSLRRLFELPRTRGARIPLKATETVCHWNFHRLS